jgi:ABC-type sugar transport system ATPase subunit/ribose/xylose/arabinose/galactoside ABC-type transport system permease subunit
MTASLAELRGIEKSFAGVRAVRGVDLAVRGGEVHGLIGENGAGKSTLMRILAGAERADAGTILWRGEAVSFGGPADAIRLGIAEIYQELSLVPALSVAENIFLGHEPLRRGGFVERAAMAAGARRLLRDLGVVQAERPEVPVETLSVAAQQMVEIAKAVSRNASLLIMDEPTASLGGAEVRALFELIRRLRERGISIVYVSHRLEEVVEIADRVTVMRDGEVVGTLATRDASIEGLIALMVGRELERPEARAAAEAREETLLDARGLAAPPGLVDASLEVRTGEIVAVWGLVGSGRSTLARAIAGVVPAESGSVTVAGKRIRGSSPAAALAEGLVYLTEDRKGQGLMLDRSLRENVAVASLGSRSAGGFLRVKEETRALGRLVGALRLRAASLEATVRNLSGGNQQKAMLARALLTEPRVLIVDEPTRGIDVGSKAEIHQLLRDIADQGRGVVMVSSELPEVLGVADRIAVMREGTLVAEFEAAKASEDALLAAATPGRRREAVATRREVGQTWVQQGGAAFVVLAALWLVAAVLSANFLSITNQSNLLGQAAVLALLALAQAFVILAGGIDLSVGATLTAASIAAAVVMNGDDGRILPGILAALAVGGAVGLANGLLVQGLRLEPFIVTLGTAAAVQGLVLSWTTGPTGAAAPRFIELTAIQVWRLPALGLASLGLVAVAGIWLRYHVRGRHIYAVGGDAGASRLSGLRVDRIRVATYTLAGLLAAVAGLFTLARFGAADPRTGIGLEFASITAVVAGGISFAGGRGTVWGALAGVGILTLVANMLNQLRIQFYWQQVVTGLIILAAVAVYQRGRSRKAAAPV